MKSNVGVKFIFDNSIYSIPLVRKLQKIFHLNQNKHEKTIFLMGHVNHDDL